MRFIVSLAFILAAGTAWAQDEKKDDRRPMLDFKYTYDFSHPDVLGRDNIAELSLLPGDAAHFLVDNAFDSLLGENTTGKKVGMLFAGAGLALFEKTALDTGHAYGHYQAFSKAGLREFILVNREDGSWLDADAPWTVAGKMWDQSLTGHEWLETVSPSDWLEFNSRPELVANWPSLYAAMEAGGLNQDQYTLERLADRFILGRGHVLDTLPWLYEFTRTLRYPSDDGDIADYVDNMSMLGVRTSASRVKGAQWPKLLSGSTAAVVCGLVDFASTGDTRLEVPSLKLGMARVYWPEFASYLSYKEGVTVKGRLPFTAVAGGWDILTDLVYERSIDTGCWEIGLQERVMTGWLGVTYDGFYNSGGGYWLEGGLVLKPCRYVELAGTYYYGADYTFHRDVVGKTFDFLESHESGFKLTVGVNIPF